MASELPYQVSVTWKGHCEWTGHEVRALCDMHSMVLYNLLAVLVDGCSIQ